MSEAALDLARASSMLDLGRHDEAAAVLARVVAGEQADSRAWCLLALAHLRADRYQDAVAAAEHASAMAPSEDWPFRLASMAAVRLGQVNRALRAANQACKLAPDDWRSWLCLARAAMATEVDFYSAERAAANARRLGPAEPDVHYVSGLVSAKRGEWRKARAHQERVLALDPSHSNAMNELGRIRLRRGGAPSAARYFLQAVRVSPGVSVYGSNVAVSVQSLLVCVIRIASAWTFVLGFVAIVIPGIPRAAVVTGQAALAAVSLVFGLVQFLRMPRETRPLFRRRRFVLALGVVYGSILAAVMVTSLAPGAVLPVTFIAAAIFMILNRFTAEAVLRRG